MHRPWDLTPPPSLNWLCDLGRSLNLSEPEWYHLWDMGSILHRRLRVSVVTGVEYLWGPGTS